MQIYLSRMALKALQTGNRPICANLLLPNLGPYFTGLAHGVKTQIEAYLVSAIYLCEQTVMLGLRKAAKLRLQARHVHLLTSFLNRNRCAKYSSQTNTPKCASLFLTPCFKSRLRNSQNLYALSYIAHSRYALNAHAV